MKVLISPGYGAGWSTWEGNELAFDKRIIDAFEKGITENEMEELCVKLGYKRPYMGGFDDLEVVEVPKGTIFRIHEYDGYESIETLNMDEWITAK